MGLYLLRWIPGILIVILGIAVMFADQRMSDKVRGFSDQFGFDLPSLEDRPYYHTALNHKLHEAARTFFRHADRQTELLEELKGLSDPAEVDRLLAFLEHVDLDVAQTKATFRRMQALARDFGFRVHDSIKEYRSRPI